MNNMDWHVILLPLYFLVFFLASRTLLRRAETIGQSDTPNETLLSKHVVLVLVLGYFIFVTNEIVSGELLPKACEQYGGCMTPYIFLFFLTFVIMGSIVGRRYMDGVDLSTLRKPEEIRGQIKDFFSFYRDFRPEFYYEAMSLYYTIGLVALCVTDFVLSMIGLVGYLR